jgi:hypothetical protein
VRQYLSTANPMGRFQYLLLVIPSFVLAAVLWIDLWRRFRDHTGNETFAWTIAGAALWGTVLAAAEGKVADYAWRVEAVVRLHKCDITPEL